MSDADIERLVLAAWEAYDPNTSWLEMFADQREAFQDIVKAVLAEQAAIEAEQGDSESLKCAAVSMGKKGGRARAAKLSPKRRLEISLKAAKARWHGP